MNQSMPPTGAKNSGLAICSLVLAILGLTCFGSIFTAIPAVICGHVALRRIRRSGGAMTGNGFAMAGLIIGYVVIALFPVMIVLVGMPNAKKAGVRARAVLCINNLRAIDHAKQQWALENHKEAVTDVPTWADITPFLPAGTQTNCPAGGTYSINSIMKPATCSIPGHDLD